MTSPCNLQHVVTYYQHEICLPQEMQRTAQPLVRRYVDSKGKTRYSGVQKNSRRASWGLKEQMYRHVLKAEHLFVHGEHPWSCIACVLFCPGCTPVPLGTASAACCRDYALISRAFVSLRSLRLQVGYIVCVQSQSSKLCCLLIYSRFIATE